MKLAFAVEGIQRPASCEILQFILSQFGYSPRQVGDVLERNDVPRSNDRLGRRFSQTAHIPEADSQNNALVMLFDGALPVGAQDVNRFYFQPVFLRILIRTLGE